MSGDAGDAALDDVGGGVGGGSGGRRSRRSRGRGRRRIRRATTAGLAAAVAAVVATIATVVALAQVGGDEADEPPELPPLQLAAQLTAFDTCPDFLSYMQERALERVSAYGLGGSGPVPLGVETPVPSPGLGSRDSDAIGPGAVPAPMPGGDAVAESASGPAGSQPYSGTNVQVAAVDEPDTVKTDGRLLVFVEGDKLRVLDAATPRLRGVLTFTEPVQELLLAGDRAVVFGAQYAYTYGIPEVVPTERSPEAGAAAAPTAFAPPPSPPASPPAEDLTVLPGPTATETTVTIVDLANPDRPRVSRSLRFTGTQVAARVVDGEIRFVLRSDPPTLPWTFPSATITPEAALEANRRLIEQTTVDDWLPRYRVADGRGAVPAAEGPLVACEDVLRPGSPGDLAMITVLTLDSEADQPGRATAVVGGGDTVYAEHTALYVAGNQYPLHPLPVPDTPTPGTSPGASPGTSPDMSPGTSPDMSPDTSPDTSPGPVAPPADVVTQIHQFDVADPAQARYVASGQVRGSLLNSYALSAADGRLRVATTRNMGGVTAADAPRSTDSAIVVLEPRDRQLVEVGQVGGLGVGEQIYAVRYLGDTAWVVTFRQTDPLYAVDLADPTRPAVRGELKLPGFSTYLLPLPGDRLLGIGESADDVRNGTKMALFDISDLSAPRLVDDEIVAGAMPQVTGDPHAFLWWAPENLAVVPVLAAWDVSGQPDGHALAFRVGEAVSLAGNLGRVGEPNPVTRAVVVGDRLFALSSAGVQVHDVASLQPGAWVPWQ